MLAATLRGSFNLMCVTAAQRHDQAQSDCRRWCECGRDPGPPGRDDGERTGQLRDGDEPDDGRRKELDASLPERDDPLLALGPLHQPGEREHAGEEPLTHPKCDVHVSTQRSMTRAVQQNLGPGRQPIFVAAVCTRVR
jgi:hypothetical protein